MHEEHRQRTNDRSAEYMWDKHQWIQNDRCPKQDGLINPKQSREQGHFPDLTVAF